MSPHRRSLPLRSITLFTLLVLALTGCAPWSRTTVTVHDPSLVSVTSETGAPALLQGTPRPARDEKITLGHGDLPTGDGTRSSYALEAVRRADGRVDLVWSTPLALSRGNVQSLPGPNEVIERDGPAAAITKRPAFERYPCARIRQEFDARPNGRYVTRHFAGFGPSLDWQPCGAGFREESIGVAVPLTVSTPWSNVTIRETSSRHESLNAALFTGVSVAEVAILVGLPTLIVGLAGGHRDDDIVGGALLGGGALVLATGWILGSVIDFRSERIVVP